MNKRGAEPVQAPPHPPDEALVQRVLAGSDEAFQALMLRHEPGIYRLAYYWTGNRDDALDLTQECFIHLYRVLARYDSRYRFTVWMYKVCTNRCINWIKSNRRAREVMPFSHLSERELDLPDDRPGPSDIAFTQEAKRQLLDAVAQLPENYRAPITLRFLEDFSYKEIAAIMDISVKNVEIRVHRAKKMLHEQLKNHLYLNEKP